MRAPEKADQRLRHELKVIEIRQREWNALSHAERASVAKVSPDLSLFFESRTCQRRSRVWSHRQGY